MSRRLVLALLALVIVLGAALRLLWLDVYPPGWHHDEALMGVMASEVYRGIQRPIFFPGYAGQEPLYIYLVAGVMALLGSQDILPVRLASALAGVATIPVAYLMGKELFGRRAGLLGAALLATSFWQVMYGRYGFRAVTQPLFEGIAVYCLWRARRERQYRWYVASGAALAAVSYTYLGGRSFPAVLVAFGVWSVLFEGRPSRAALRRVSALAAAFVAVATPIYLYWLSNPGTYGARMSQVFILDPAISKGQPWQYLSSNVANALSMFTVHGEEMWRYNLPGRPVFEWALGPLFYLGVALALWRSWRRDAGSALLVIWLLVMLAPGTLAHDLGGNSLRAMGLVPALFLFPAIGLDGAWRWVASRSKSEWSVRWATSVFAVACAGVVIFDAGLTYRDYFLDWSRQFGTAYQTDAHVVAEARYLAAEAHPDREQVFAGSDYRGHPIISQLAPNVYQGLRWFDGRYAVVYSPAADRDSRYVLSFSTLPPGDLSRYFPPETLVGQQPFDRGIEPGLPPPPKYVAYLLRPDQVRTQVERWLSDPATIGLRANLGDEVELLGAQVPPVAKPGEVMPVTAVWRVLKPPSADDYMFFVHLLDDRGKMWSQDDRNGYPTLEWRPGDVVVSRFELAAPEGLSSGKYLVDFGLYDRRDLRRLEIRGSPSKTSQVLSPVKVLSSEPPAPAKNSVRKAVGGDFTLEGYDLDSSRTADGQTVLDVRLLWSARGKPAEDYTVFVQVLSPDGKLVAQSDAMPAANRWPTSIWDRGDVVPDTHRIALPPGQSTGSYRLIAGMYLLGTGHRLPADGGDFITLGDFVLQP